jgi:hypothetical protein
MQTQQFKEIAFDIGGKYYLVLSLEGEESLHNPFHFTLSLLVKKNNNLWDALGKHATLHFIDPPHQRDLQGIITQVQHGTRDADQHYACKIDFQSQLSLLKNYIRPHLDVNKNVREIIQHEIDSLLKMPIHWHMIHSCPTKPHHRQVANENSHHYFQRLLAFYGLYYWSGIHSQREVLHISDHNQANPQIFQHTLTHTPRNTKQSGILSSAHSVYSISKTNTAAAQKIKVSDYLPDQGQQLDFTTPQNTESELDYFAEGHLNTAQLKSFAYAKQAQAKAASENVQLKTHCLSLGAGWALYLDADKSFPELSKQYLIQRIDHHARQQYSDGKLQASHYHNTTTLHACEHKYVPPTPSTIISPQVFVSKIQENDCRIPDIDPSGRYIFKFLGDQSQKKDSSFRTRFMSPYVSAQNNLTDTGLHTPLAPDTLCLLSTLHQQANDFFILGTLPHITQVSPVSHPNQKDHRWDTKGQHSLIFNDQLQKISAQEENQSLTYIRSPSYIQLKARYGKVRLHSGNAMRFQCDEGLHEIICQDRLHYCQQDYKIHVKKGGIHLHSQMKTSFSSNNFATLHATQNMSFNASRHLCFNLNGQCVQFSKKIISFESNDTLKIKAKTTTLFQASESLLISAGSATIKLHSNGSIQVYAPQISLGNFLPATKIHHASAGPPPPPSPILAASPLPDAIPTLSAFIDKPLHCDHLCIHLCDKKNDASPHTKIAAMHPLFAGLTVTISHLHQKKKVFPVLHSRLLMVPLNTTQTITSLHLTIEFGPPYHDQTCYITAKNKQPIFPPTNTLTLHPEDWAQQTSLHDNPSVCLYHTNLTLLEPFILFNFRHDFCLAKNTLPKKDKTTYKQVQHYFAPLQSTPTHLYADKLPAWLIESLLANGKTVTFLIHGFNLHWGEFPSHFSPLSQNEHNDSAYQKDGTSETLCRDNDFLQSLLGKNYSRRLPPEEKEKCDEIMYNGHGVQHWFLHMEHNFNRAAGHYGKNKKNYQSYSRLIHIAWQGDPHFLFDYKAASALSDFPAEKTFRLIQQCQQAGIKINLVAHSLGCTVLMKILSLCGKANLPVTHAFLWQAALPNNAFKTTSPKPSPKSSTHCTFPLKEHFPCAQSGAKKISVLYSKNDNILGGAELSKILADITPEKFLVRICTLISTLQTLVNSAPNILKFLHNNPDWDKIFFETFLADLFSFIDYTLQAQYNFPQKFTSVYHMATLFAFPLSFLLSSKNKTGQFFKEWKNNYQYLSFYANGSLSTLKIPLTFEKTQAHFQQHFTSLYRFCAEIASLLQTLSSNSPSSFSSLLQPNAIDYASAYLTYPYTLMFTLEKSLGKKILQKTLPTPIEKLLAQPLLQYFSHHHSELLTCLLLGLTTKEAKIPPAMGVTGSTVHFDHYSSFDQGTLLTEHSGMVTPNSEFYNKVYKNILFGEGENSLVK